LNGKFVDFNRKRAKIPQKSSAKFIRTETCYYGKMSIFLQLILLVLEKPDYHLIFNNFRLVILSFAIKFEGKFSVDIWQNRNLIDRTY